MQITTEVPDELLVIGELLRTQDNRLTDQPLFIVQRRVRHWGIDSEHENDGYVWVETESGDYSEADERTAKRLDALDDDGRSTGKWEKSYYRQSWEFVTACFTEAGCADHIRMNGHNLGETRIYADGSYRNPEYRAVRDFLMSLPPPPVQVVPHVRLTESQARDLRSLEFSREESARRQFNLLCAQFWADAGLPVIEGKYRVRLDTGCLMLDPAKKQ